ncbi:hypothetical protein U1Q18_010842 [Sarracenia purpurea var. burkii]
MNGIILGILLLSIFSSVYLGCAVWIISEAPKATDRGVKFRDLLSSQSLCCSPWRLRQAGNRQLRRRWDGHPWCDRQSGGQWCQLRSPKGGILRVLGRDCLDLLPWSHRVFGHTSRGDIPSEVR